MSINLGGFFSNKNSNVKNSSNPHTLYKVKTYKDEFSELLQNHLIKSCEFSYSKNYFLTTSKIPSYHQKKMLFNRR